MPPPIKTFPQTLSPAYSSMSLTSCLSLDPPRSIPIGDLLLSGDINIHSSVSEFAWGPSLPCSFRGGSDVDLLNVVLQPPGWGRLDGAATRHA
jgi:hypothetical protein